jgi:hypothetical protein
VPGFAIGATVATLPAAAAALSVAGAPYWYANGVYVMESGPYVVVPLPQGAVVTAPLPFCSVVYVGSSKPSPKRCPGRREANCQNSR